MDQKLLKSLLMPDVYPEPTNYVRLLQTHVSFLFITDNFVSNATGDRKDSLRPPVVVRS